MPSWIAAGPGSRFAAAMPSWNSLSLIHPRSLTQRRWSIAISAGGPPNPGPVPDLIFDAERSLQEYGVDAVAVPSPGHTRGSLSVFTASGDALVGDLLGGGGRSRTSPARGVFVCDEEAMEASIREVIARGPRLVHTGHDRGPFTLKQLTEAFA